MTDTLQPPRRHCHITIVSETFPPEINGVANTLKYLCQGLLQRGHKVTVVRPCQANEATGSLASTGEGLFTNEWLVPGFPLPGYPELRFGLIRTSSLVRQWQKQRPDALYVATQGPLGLAAVTAARRLAIPVSSGFHTNFHSYSRYYGAGFLEKFLLAYGRWFHNRTAITLVPTQRIKQLVSDIGIKPVGLWSRGVDCHRFAPHKRDISLRQEWGLRSDDCAVLYVGRLASEKNLQMVSAGFERIRSLHPGAKLVLVGDGPLRKRMAERHPDYIFCGVQRGEDLPRHYASGDLFLFPSKTDTFGNVVTEAMASGLAVIAFDDAAASELVRHEENGMKVHLDDDEGFVNCALRLADQPSLRRRIRERARLDALELDWPTQIEQFETLVLNPQQKAIRYASSKQSFSLF